MHERQTETRKKADERSNGSASVTDLAATASTGMAIYVTVNEHTMDCGDARRQHDQVFCGSVARGGSTKHILSRT